MHRSILPSFHLVQYLSSFFVDRTEAMYRSLLPSKCMGAHMLGRIRQTFTWSSGLTRRSPGYDIFINHSGKDTKRNIAVLLYDRFINLEFHPFLDYKTMNPGDELQETIESAIRNCKVGVTIFSPCYCRSDNCLKELALLMECKKKVIPIFYDVKPSDLVLLDDGTYPANQLHQFRMALELAKARVGIPFESCNGDWVDLLKRASDSVVEILME